MESEYNRGRLGRAHIPFDDILDDCEEEGDGDGRRKEERARAGLVGGGGVVVAAGIVGGCDWGFGWETQTSPLVVVCMQRMEGWEQSEEAAAAEGACQQV